MLRKILTLTLLISAVGLAGCSSQKPGTTKASKNSFGESLAGFRGKGSSYYSGRGPIPHGGGRYWVGNPYQIAGRWFTPQVQPGYDRKGAASWYGEAFHRRKTSNGEYFDMNMMTAAHPTLPLPSYARVTNLENGNVIVVRINDRGPFVGTRIIDLSKRSAEALRFKSKGKANVRVQWIGNAPLNDQGGHLAMMNRKAVGGAGMPTLITAADGTARGGDYTVEVAEVSPESKVGDIDYNVQRLKKKSRAEAQIVEVASFVDLGAAEQARAALSAIGPVQVYQWESKRGPIYKVQLGPFHSQIGAAEALDAVRGEGYRGAALQTAHIEQAANNG